MRALVVDDHQAIRDSLCQWLTKCGFARSEIRTGATLEDALDIARTSTTCALVVIDLQIPYGATAHDNTGFNGFMLARALIALNEQFSQRTNYLLMSGFDNHQQRILELFHQIGHAGVGYYSKNSDAAAFKQAVQAVMRRDSALHQRVDSKLHEEYDPLLSALKTYLPKSMRQLIDVAREVFPRIDLLSNAQRQLFYSVADGKTYARIASETGHPVHKIEYSVRQIKATLFSDDDAALHEKTSFSTLAQIMIGMYQQSDRKSRPRDE